MWNTYDRRFDLNDWCCMAILTSILKSSITLRVELNVLISPLHVALEIRFGLNTPGSLRDIGRSDEVG